MECTYFPIQLIPLEESHDDTVDIGVDRVHPVPVAEVAFPAATVIATLDRHGGAIRGIYEHLQRVPVDEDVIALRFKVEIELEFRRILLSGNCGFKMESLRTRQRLSVRSSGLALMPPKRMRIAIPSDSMSPPLDSLLSRETPPRGMEATIPEGMTEGIADTDMYQVVSTETEKMDKYISGLPDNVYGNVKSSKPKTLDETIELANELMDQKLRIYAERQTDNKRKADDLSRNNHSHQQKSFKKQNVAKTYAVGSGEEKEPTRTLATLMMKSKL
ncbi:hypothetical protein Tco_0830439 [Tanacetum coccineum]